MSQANLDGRFIRSRANPSIIGVIVGSVGAGYVCAFKLTMSKEWMNGEKEHYESPIGSVFNYSDKCWARVPQPGVAEIDALNYYMGMCMSSQEDVLVQQMLETQGVQSVMINADGSMTVDISVDDDIDRTVGYSTLQ